MNRIIQKFVQNYIFLGKFHTFYARKMCVRIIAAGHNARLEIKTVLPCGAQALKAARFILFS